MDFGNLSNNPVQKSGIRGEEHLDFSSGCEGMIQPRGLDQLREVVDFGLDRVRWMKFVMSDEHL